ncbi:MAG: hydrogenase [Actinobacteria bacterium]|nr:hydrogenase [Actinomycetota bacterium]
MAAATVLSSPSTFTSVVTLFGVGVLVTEFLMLRAHLLRSQVRLYMVQSFLVAAVALVTGIEQGNSGLYVVSVLSFIIKVVIVPMVILRLMSVDSADLSQSAIMKLPSMLYIALVTAACGFFIGVSFRTASVIGRGTAASGNAVSVDIAIVLVAFILIVLRRDVISQVAGFFSLENGVTLFSVSVARNMPFITEVATFFDLLVAAVVFGLLMRLHHMKTRTLSTHVLDRLKG